MVEETPVSLAGLRDSSSHDPYTIADLAVVTSASWRVHVWVWMGESMWSRTCTRVSRCCRGYKRVPGWFSFSHLAPTWCVRARTIEFLEKQDYNMQEVKYLDNIKEVESRDTGTITIFWLPPTPLPQCFSHPLIETESSQWHPAPSVERKDWWNQPEVKRCLLVLVAPIYYPPDPIQESCKYIQGPAPPICPFGAGTSLVQIISVWPFFWGENGPLNNYE